MGYFYPELLAKAALTHLNTTATPARPSNAAPTAVIAAVPSVVKVATGPATSTAALALVISAAPTAAPPQNVEH